jgi:hypothetical protein
VRLVNTDGMTFIGPGSEWFWTAVSGMVLAVTFIAIWRQLRMQRSAAVIEQMATLQREFDSEALARSRLAVLEALRAGSEPLGLAGSNPAAFWDRVGYLVRRGHVDRRIVYQEFGDNARLWWGWLGGIVRLERERDQNPAFGSDFEWLAERMAEMDHRVGRTITYDEAYLAERLAPYIEYNRATIREAEELRAVVIRPLAQQLTPVPAPTPPAG